MPIQAVLRPVQPSLSTKHNMSSAIAWTAVPCSKARTQGPASVADTCARRLACAAAAVVVATTTTQLLPAHCADVAIYDHDKTLINADFSGRNLRGAIFTKANCKGANFANADLTNAQLDDANFQGATLDNASASNLLGTQVKFQRASLRNVDFTNANLVSAFFDGADITGADFSDALLDRATVLKLCTRASGIHPQTGVPTVESLMCPEEE